MPTPLPADKPGTGHLTELSHRSAESSLPHAFGEPRLGGSKPTSADGPVPHVARFAGAAVALDSVGADGVLITVVLPAATLVVFCPQREKERDTFT